MRTKRPLAQLPLTFLIAASFASCWSPVAVAQTAARIEVDTNTVTGTVSPYFFGQFIEHEHNTIQGVYGLNYFTIENSNKVTSTVMASQMAGFRKSGSRIATGNSITGPVPPFATTSITTITIAAAHLKASNCAVRRPARAFTKSDCNWPKASVTSFTPI